MELPVYKLDGTQSGEAVTLNEEVFGAAPKDHLVYRVIVSHLAAQRQGTHLARNRSMVSGSGRKPHRQKAPVVHGQEPLNPTSGGAAENPLDQSPMNTGSELTRKKK